MPDVTVVVPTRNRASVLEDSLASLAVQRGAGSIEIVVVDNGSTDGTADVVARWAQRDRRFRGISEGTPGRSHAMNAGIGAARSKLILFTDDDVVVDPWWAGSIQRFFARHRDADVAGGAIVPVASDLGPWPPWMPADVERDIGGLSWGDRERPLGSHEHLWGANMAMTTDTIARHGMWDTSVGRREDHRGTFEDVEYQERVRRAGGSIWFVPGAVIRHRIPRENVTPRRIVSAAFRRGRNDVAMGRPFAPESDPLATGDPPRRPIVRWVAATAALRTGLRRDRLERARARAYAAGWSTRSADASVVRRERRAWRTAQLVIRATPGRSSSR